jgi:hypothetical protein
MEDGVSVMRPVDPPGENRRWACGDHFDRFSDPEVERLVSTILGEDEKQT